MFGRNRRRETSIYNEPMDAVLEEMRHVTTTADEYVSQLEYLERLAKLKAEEHRGEIDPNTVLLVLGNLAGILAIVAYEQKHVLSTKAMGFLARLK